MDPQQLQAMLLNFQSDQDNHEEAVKQLAEQLGIPPEMIVWGPGGKICDFCQKLLDKEVSGYKCSKCQLYYDKCPDCLPNHPEDYCHQEACRPDDNHQEACRHDDGETQDS